MYNYLSPRTLQPRTLPTWDSFKFSSPSTAHNTLETSVSTVSPIKPQKRKGSVKSPAMKITSTNIFTPLANGPLDNDLTASCVICKRTFGSMDHIVECKRCRCWTCQQCAGMSNEALYMTM